LKIKTLALIVLISMPILTINIGQVKAEEPTLVAILNTLGFRNIEELTSETFIPGTYNITLYAEFADYHASNNLSWYTVGTNNYNLIFSGPEGNFGYVDPPINKSFTTNTTFGLSFFSPEARYFTETNKNPDGIKHAMVYINLDNPGTCLIGFENTLGGGDGDYNDMVISLTIVNPVRYWALIICGEFMQDPAWSPFPLDTAYMYHVLSEHYVFDDIYYLHVNTSVHGVNALATKANVSLAINTTLASWSDENDVIFI
jgi:hypothetical protein